MNALWPCQSCTPKSLSKLLSGTMVYQGICQPIRVLMRSRSVCRPRET
ncbi:Uncharacterised protein [Mycobacteroides abscessus subsp. abscessus]|nr:Uncharacterised protein [Mycobacteroides abscessus subsp. abscessus]